MQRLRTTAASGRTYAEWRQAVIGPDVQPWLPASPKATSSCLCSRAPACTTSFTLDAVPTTLCTSQECMSTPMWAFMPKYHWLPFLVWCISGSRSPWAYFVELGAAIFVASTTAPFFSVSPLACKMSLTTRSMSLARSFFSRR